MKPVGTKKVGHLVGIRVPTSSMTYRFFSIVQDIKVDDSILLRVQDDEIAGLVVFVTEEKGTKEFFQDRLFVGNYDVGAVKDTITQILSEREQRFFGARETMEAEAKYFCKGQIREMGLPMKLIKVIYVFGGSKAIFFFTAEKRVDFRELVRALGRHLKVRVEMRHVGVRDDTKILGGMGVCGNAFCCSQHLQKFHPVSVRMAKNQELSLNPEGISGTCGRLLCCLAYEDAAYQALRSDLPKLKKQVQTLDGREGVVCSIHPLTQTVDLQFTDGSRSCVAHCDLCRGEKSEKKVETLLPSSHGKGKQCVDLSQRYDLASPSDGKAAVVEKGNTQGSALPQKQPENLSETPGVAPATTKRRHKKKAESRRVLPPGTVPVVPGNGKEPVNIAKEPSKMSPRGSSKNSSRGTSKGFPRKSSKAPFKPSPLKPHLPAKEEGTMPSSTTPKESVLPSSVAHPPSKQRKRRRRRPVPSAPTEKNTVS